MRFGTERGRPFLSLRPVAAWVCVLGSLSYSIGTTRASTGPQENAKPATKSVANPAPQKKANPAAKGTADSAEFKKLAARATEARHQNRLQEAVGLYQKALRLNPRWKEGWWYLGTLYYDDDQYPRGLDAFKNLVELDRDLGTGWSMLGLCEFETGDYPNSFLHLNRGIQKGLPNDLNIIWVIHYHIALLDIMRSDFDAGYDLLRGLVFQGNRSSQVRFAMGLALLRVPLLPSQVDPTKDAVIDKAGEAGELMALEHYNEAEPVFQQLIQEYPTTPFTHYAYGAMLSKFAQPEKAAEQFKEEIKVNPDSAWPYIQLAYAYLNLKQYQDALTYSRKAHELVPDLFIPRYLSGRVLLGLNQVHDAVDELEAAKDLAPSVAEIRYNLAIALARDNQPKAAAVEREAFQRLEAVIQQKRRLVHSPENSTGASTSLGTPGSGQARDPSRNTPQ